jgi:hypothetical protein
MRSSKPRRQDRHGPPSPLPSSSEPTAERQHRAETIEAPQMNGVRRPWWGIRTRLDALHRDGLITLAAHAAAEELRRDCERTDVVLGSPLARIGAGPAARLGAPDDSMMLARLNSASRLRVIRQRLGARDFAVVLAVVVADLSWCELGRRLGCRDETAKRRAGKIIERLADATPPAGHRHQLNFITAL